MDVRGMSVMKVSCPPGTAGAGQVLVWSLGIIYMGNTLVENIHWIHIGMEVSVDVYSYVYMAKRSKVLKYSLYHYTE